VWKEFLRRIWAKGEGWVFISHGKGDHWKDVPFQYPSQMDLIVDTIKTSNTWTNTYFCPHLFTKPRRKKDSAGVTYTLWIDYDSPLPHKISPKPTICWKTSEKRHQAVWILEEPADPHDAETLNRKLTYYNKGDKGGWALTKVIRVPETINYKYSPPYQGFVLWDDGPVYKNLDDLKDKLDHQTPDDETQQKQQEAQKLLEQQELPDELPTFEQAIKTYGKKLSKATWDLLETPPKPDEGWSDNLWKLERLLIESGLPPEHVFVIVENSPWNKYARDGRPPEHLWREILKAFDERTAVVEEQSGLPWVGMNTLLLYSERPEWMVDGIWMDKNVGWIAGVGKSYKSVISLDLAVSIATGVPFLGRFEVLKPGPVLMIQEEDPIWRVAHRLQMICEAKGIDVPKLHLGEDSLELNIPGSKDIPLLISCGGGFTFTNEDMINNIEQAIELYKPKMLFFDPFFMLSPGVDEFKAGETTRILNLMKYWRNTYDCAIAVIHHYNKSKEGSGSSKLYGTMAFYAWAENNLFVDRVPGNVISVQRDIKDAIENDKILVQFEDMDDKFSYHVEIQREEYQSKALETTGKDALSKALAYLSNFDPGQKIPRKQVMDGAGLSQSTVKKVFENLEAMGLGSVVYEGTDGLKGAACKLMLSENIKLYKSGGLNPHDAKLTV